MKKVGMPIEKTFHLSKYLICL